jgi:hypothetical protein
VIRIECLGCGHVLMLPASIPEGGDFACAHCGLWMRNVEAARRFRWQDVEPYVRHHGASRANLWGGLAGAALWLPLLACVLAVQGRLDGPFLAVLGLPYLALLAVFGAKRARIPGTVWQYWLWIGLGGYGLYVGTVLVLEPEWAPLLSGTSGVDMGPLGFFGLGAIGVLAGAIGVAVHRRRARKVPRISGTPPAID